MINFSPSKLNDFQECPRCFWLEKNKGIKRPRGIMAGLPGGMDRLLKKRYDDHRKENKIPKEIESVVENRYLFRDQEQLRKWRYWKTGPNYTTKQWMIRGAIDDILMDSLGVFTPLDYKTKGAEPKTDGSEYYGRQMDAYDLMFSKNGFQTSGKALLVYYWPVYENLELDGNAIPVSFQSTTYELEASGRRAEEYIERAVKCALGEVPESNQSCEYCEYKEAT